MSGAGHSWDLLVTSREFLLVSTTLPMFSYLCGCRPEIYKNQEYRVEVDMFSFGVHLFRLLSGKRPFSSSSKKKLALLVMGNKYTMDDDNWSVVSDEAKDFVRLLIIQRDRRLTAESASLHPWFRTRPPTGGSKRVNTTT